MIRDHAEEKAKVSPIGENTCCSQTTYRAKFAGKTFLVDEFLDRVPGPDYNCLDFTREVWLAWTGEDITAKLTGLVGAFKTREVTTDGVRGFDRLLEPVSPCFVVMQRLRLVPHVGIFLEGRILHMPDRGAEYQPLIVAQAHYHKIRYYR